MQCSEEIIARLFYNVSSSFQIFLLFTYFTSILLAKFFYFFGDNPFSWRNHDGYEFSDDEEMEEENEYYHHHNNSESMEENHLIDDEFLGFEKEIEESCSDDDDEESIYSSVLLDSESIYSDDDEVEVKEVIDYDSDSDFDSYSGSEINKVGPTSPLPRDMNTNVSTNIIDKDIDYGNCYRDMTKDKKVIEINLCTREENVFVNASSSSKLENNKKILQLVEEKEEKDEEHEIFGDSCTNGSTSKSSTEWRSSIKDSTTDDPFSSSSRRSCPKWESYTIFQKYDEEMLFFDRISAQKLHETESLRSIQACPRSISDRIVHKLFIHKKSSQHHNPYHELEAAYVAQVCLAWEALSWNYKYFQRLRASHTNNNNKESKDDPGCPAYVAQHFQQFQVLLQRYVENEPYENGKRPDIYARMRSLAPKLLQVPEYRDSEEDKGTTQEEYCSRISSESFHQIMKEAIRTFMNFLKADKENRCQILMAAFLRRKKRGSPNAALLFLLKKENKKKKSKVKDLGRSGKCLRNKRRLREEEEMEILMCLIDLKLVSRVLRMRQVNDEQLHWCEDKMSKVKISDGKLQRDSSPLFFPAH